MTPRNSKKPPARSRRTLRDILPPSVSSATPAHEPVFVEPNPPVDVEPAVFHEPGAPRAEKAVPEFLRRPPAGRAGPPARAGHEPVVREWQTAHPARRISRKAYGMAGALVLLLLALGAPTFLVPSLRITVVPKLVHQPVNFAFVADVNATSPDTARRIVPALAVTLERSIDHEYEATGSKFVRERARGTVRLFNAYSTAPQTLVATTRLQDSAGRIYRLVNGVVIPGAVSKDGALAPSSITADVAADEPGEKFNIGPTEFRIPGFRGTPRYQGFYAKSEGAMTGGFEGQARVVTAADIKRASEELSARAIEELSRELTAKIPHRDDVIIPDGGRYAALADIKHPPVDSKADRFVMTVAASGKLLAISRTHVAELANAFILPPAAGDAETVIPRVQDRLTISGTLGGPEATQARVTLGGELAYYQAFKADDMAAALKASAPNQAIETLLGRPEVDAIRVKRFPRWLWFTPQRSEGFMIAVEPPAS